METTIKKSTLLEREESIAYTKETFEKCLKKELSLTKISSPLIVLDGTGINDDLNGYERSIKFPIKSLNDSKGVVVHSLAKWKRLRLKELDIEEGKGIVTDMRALRPDEDISPIHSIYVDQWDWEKCMSPYKRDLDFLKETVNSIYKSLKITELKIYDKYPEITPILPDDITFIHTEDLLKEYPHLTPKERETEAAKKYGAIFLIGIGDKLSNGQPHDGRASDYDDWSLNGDIILWNPILKSGYEISSMGIRVDKDSLLRQLEVSDNLDRKELLFHKLLLNGELPQSIGGGIGQSRVAMFLLRKKHIGEVQVGIWPEEVKSKLKKEGIELF